MLLRSARIAIRSWRLQDDELADEWPSYNDPFEPLWNLPRQLSSVSGSWSSYFDSGGMRRSWAIENQLGRLIGRISLREIDERRRQARLGITVSAAHVSRGLGTEALAIFLDHFFGEMGFDMMVLDVAAPNQRAVHCYERLGFEYVGSDWREAGANFSASILDEPVYAYLRQFFQRHQHGLLVQFFEMQLSQQKWRQWRY